MGALVSRLGGDCYSHPFRDAVPGGKLKEAGNERWGLPGIRYISVLRWEQIKRSCKSNK
ncbi:MAG: hypothetical protein HGA37_14940 [Lentimicrobium sp.]|nr:hypothetical protein [Lentimicrobium sp.]